MNSLSKKILFAIFAKRQFYDYTINFLSFSYIKLTFTININEITI